MEKNSQNGFTLIELIAVVTIIGIIAAIALPSFKSLLENRKLIASANTLQSDLQYTKSEAIKQNKPMFVSFENIGSNNWCYGINESAACDCSVPEDCSVKTVNSAKLPAVTLTTASVVDISYNQFSGFANSGGRFVFTLSGKTTGVNVSLNGQARACSDSNLGGFVSC